ncbi:MarR family transcriptional regulator [Nonomuraea sp. NPDC049421]|uniref:MarR family winged helix-turn-helix transcriptional regulator n=1 Tax=Nonomuraea sp. NPDC049421 TaxID=3155275 RepID=UPI00341D8A59
MSDEPEPDHNLGWTLGVLLRAYQSTVVTVIGDLPHGPRGYQTLAAVVGGRHPTQLSLASFLGIDRTVLTYLVDDLVEAGLVERRLNPSDRRQRRIVATGEGVRVYEDLERRVGDAEDHLLGALSADEREAFRSMLRRVACDVSDIEPAKDPCEVAEEMLAD